MNHLRDHIKTKTILKISGAAAKKKGIKSLIESSFQCANKIAEKPDKKSKEMSNTNTVHVSRLSELRYKDENDTSEDEDKQTTLSNSLSMSTFKRINIKRRITVVAVFSDRSNTVFALTQLERVCEKLDAELTEIKFEKLDFGEYNVLDMFYNADICVVDMSVLSEQASLFYHLGVRESTGMKDNIIVTEDESDERTLGLKVSCNHVNFFFNFLSFL